MREPFFSIIIPVYNVEQYIARCLDSCINQTFKDIEIIVVDDCGDDHSMKIAEKYAKEDRRIKIIHNPRNLGLFHTRIVGEKEAKGKYILCLDSDDFIDLHTCKILYNTLQQDYKSSGQWSDIVHFGMEFYPRNFKNTPPIIHTNTMISNLEILQNLFLKPETPNWSIWGRAYNKTVIAQTNNFLKQIIPKFPNIIMVEDVLKLLVISLFLQKSIGTKNKLYHYCHSLTSITRNKEKETKKKKINDIIQVINIIQHIASHEQTQTKIFQLSCKKINQYLRSIIELENRYDQGKKTYLRSCFKSIRLYYRWQTLARICIYLISFGKIKL